MANFRNTSDLKKLALQFAGEKADGTSPYDSVALAYLNQAYEGLIAGGDIMGVDVTEPWTWARATRPIIGQISPQFTFSATMTVGSLNGVFPSAPVDQYGNNISVKDWYLKSPNTEDFFVIRAHISGQTNFQLDSTWIDDSGGVSGAYEIQLIKFEYDLFDDTIVIDDYNSTLEFNDNSGHHTATVVPGVYNDATTFCTAIVTALTSAGASAPTCSFNALTRKFVVGQGGPSFSLLIAGAQLPELSGWPTLGFDVYDHTGAVSYTSENILNGIQRFVESIRIYRNTSIRYQAPEDTGHVYFMDTLSLNRHFPIHIQYPYVPDVSSVTRWNPNGTCRVRFNSIPEFIMRFEVDYIPIPQDLYDNAASIPPVPRAYRDYLSYYAAYKLMLDKSDNRAPEYEKLAIKKLQSMIHDNRTNKSLGQNRYGRLLPRAVVNRPWRVFP